MILSHLLEASGAPAFYIAPKRLDYCTQEAVPSQGATKCSQLHNSVKLGMCSPELEFSLFCDISGAWTFLKYALKSRASYAASLGSARLCLSYDEKRFVINSSRNSSSLDDVPSQ